MVECPPGACPPGACRAVKPIPSVAKSNRCQDTVRAERRSFADSESLPQGRASSVDSSFLEADI